MVDLLAELTNSSRDATVAISPFVAGEERTDLPFQCLVFITCLSRLLLVVERATRQTRQFE